MADDVIVSNAPTSVNPDIDVRTTETTTGKHIQHMRLDIGTGTAESVVDVSNPLPVIIDASQPAFAILNEGEVIASNSTTVPLGAAASFTGAAFEILNYAVINVCVYADVPSAITNGVKVEFSPDGVNWDHSHETIYTSTSGVGYIFNCEYRYARVVYTNGNTPQTVFRLQTIVKTTRVQSSLYTLAQIVSGNAFAELVKAELIAKNPFNTWEAINCTAGGNLKISVEEFDPTVLGQKTMVNSLPVAIASNQSAVPASQSGNWSVRLQDGAGQAITSHKAGTDQALDVNILTSAGIVQQFASIQYQENTTPTNLTGTQINWVEGSTQRCTSLLKPLPIQLRTSTGTEIGGNAAPLVTDLALPTAIVNGQSTTTSGTRKALNPTSLLVKAVTIKALRSNTSRVFVGGSGVTTANGFELNPGDAVSFDFADLQNIYFDVAVSSEGISFLGIQ